MGVWLVGVVLTALVLTPTLASGHPPSEPPDPPGAAAAAPANQAGADVNPSSKGPAATGAPAPWSWPVSHPREVVRGFDLPEVAWGPGHRGVDLRADVGSFVRSPADGVVTFAGAVAGKEVVVVAHQSGVRSTFEPVRAVASAGAVVARGQPIGTLTASPGHCLPVRCVHWGVLRGSTYLDPMALLRTRVVLLPTR